MFADEELVMELLVNAGQARSDAMEAIRCAGQKDWQGATQLMASSDWTNLTGTVSHTRPKFWATKSSWLVTTCS